MATLGIIDDRNDKRTSFARKINLEIRSLDSTWNVIDIEPFLEKTDYISWINENNIASIIIDERLYEGETVSGKNINYTGHELVEFLRKRLKDIPLYIITSIHISDELKSIYNQFNLILSSKEFDDRLKHYLNLIIMSGNNFFNTHKKELEKLSNLSEKIAFGTANPKEIEEAKALQIKLSIPHTIEKNVNREKWLSEIEELTNDLSEISTDINKYLKGK